jgi:hypothetical protein
MAGRWDILGRAFIIRLLPELIAFKIQISFAAKSMGYESVIDLNHQLIVCKQHGA